MMTTNAMSAAVNNDADLVGASLAGNRDAFGQIVARYQSLICSLAYNATGSLTQSEDLAQETFVAAWKQLAGLREPEKLRPWLCGIARNLINNTARRHGREPSHAAESIELAAESPSHEASPTDQTISKEEEAILWRSIERIPETYREPLILFYREHQSVERVAAQLELTEDAVHQRLSRGRKLLAEEVMAFVAGALARTNPGQAFTLGVLAALPLTLTTSAKAATVVAAAAKGGATATGITFLSVFSVMLGPAIGFFCGFLGARQGYKSLRSPRERALAKRFLMLGVIVVALFTASLTTLSFTSLGESFWKHNPKLFIVTGVAVTLGWVVFVFTATFRFNRALLKIRAEEQAADSEFENLATAWSTLSYRPGKPWEYRSRATLLGLPLVHFTAGRTVDNKAKPAIGWIASGEKAYGILFASGAFAVGGISIGGFSVGLFAFGGLSAGLFAFGGLALGAVCMGGMGMGLVASGGLALGWHAAMGGVAAAHHIAFGGAALANHANDAVARNFVLNHPWLNIDRPLTRNVFWLACFLPMVIQMAALTWWRRRIMRRTTLK